MCQTPLGIFIPSSDIQKLMLEVVVGGWPQEAWERPYCLCSWKTLGRKEVCHPNHTMLEQEGCQCASVNPVILIETLNGYIVLPFSNVTSSTTSGQSKLLSLSSMLQSCFINDTLLLFLK